jgi:hypothetical protein
LQHIGESIARITGYIQGIDNASALESDHKTQAAVIRYSEIIGEAANRIYKEAPEFVAAHPEGLRGSLSRLRRQSNMSHGKINHSCFARLSGRYTCLLISGHQRQKSKAEPSTSRVCHL